MSKLPVVPRSFLSEQGHALQKSIEGEMGAMQEELNIADERRESVYKCTRQIFRSVAKVMFEMSIGNFDNVASTIEETSVGVSGALALIENNDHQTKREGNLSSAIESFVETRSQPGPTPWWNHKCEDAYKWKQQAFTNRIMDPEGYNQATKYNRKLQDTKEGI